ncbi:hypothetical protein GEMRC1_013790 [Eukaryota sp. GEM-RC1]
MIDDVLSSDSWENVKLSLFNYLFNENQPALVVLMKLLLYSHSKHCSDNHVNDPFADFLLISDLKKGETVDQSPPAPEEESCPFPIDLVHTLMDMLALTRGEAIQALTQNDGNIEMVIGAFLG